MGASNIVWIIRALLVSAVFIAGWWIKGRIDKSYAQEQEIASLTAKASAVKESDDSRIVFEIGEKKAEDKVRTIIKVVKRDVVRILPSNPDCTLGPSVTRLLNNARGYDVPEAPNITNGAGPAAPQTP